jgi:hypothetical protein
MADIIDDGNKTAEFFLKAALQNRQRGAVQAPSGVGMCLNCGADVEGDRRWCDADCRDDWEKEQKRRGC